MRKRTETTKERYLLAFRRYRFYDIRERIPLPGSRHRRRTVHLSGIKETWFEKG